MKVETIRNRFDRVMAALESVFRLLSGAPLTNDQVAIIAKRIVEVLHGKEQATRESLRVLTLMPFNRDNARWLIWHICANVEALKCGKVLPYYSGLTFAGTEYVRIIKVAFRDNKYVLTFRVLTGHFAGGSLSQALSEAAFCRFLGRIGFSGCKYFLTANLSECALGLYAQVTLEPSDNPLIDVIEDKDITSYNRRKIIRMRYRLEDAPCCVIRKQYPGMLCTECPATVEDCEASYGTGSVL